MDPGEINIDPIQDEFFNTDALEDVAAPLVREAIQNSLDAKAGGAPVRVRFRHAPASHGLSREQAAPFLRNLHPHLIHGSPAPHELPAGDERLSFLIIEDFNTRGLRGDPAQHEDERTAPDPQSERNDFYYFWRNIGRSTKSSSELGRWGLGKTVYQWASRINSFFGLTVRAGDSQPLLMGQSTLRTHKREGQRHYPYGYFASFDHRLPMPIRNADLIHRFCEYFDLHRGNQPGLSIVIPYPRAGINAPRILRSVLRHYFFPLLTGKLIVDVDVDGQCRRIDQNSLDRIALQDPSLHHGFLKLLALARWGIDATDIVSLHAPDRTSAPSWKTNWADIPGIDELRRRFNAGDPVAFRMPVWVKPTSAPPKLSEFYVYLAKDDRLQTSEEHFVRDGITVAGVRAGLQLGVRSIVTTTHQPLSQLLGDAENPAHTVWQERSPKFKDRYRHGASTLRYVKHAPRELVKVLTDVKNRRDETLLKHIFSLNFPTSVHGTALRIKGEEKRRTQTPDLHIQQVQQDLMLQRAQGGFRLSLSPQAGHTIPLDVEVKIAYEVRRGDPFKHYHPYDFNVDEEPIRVNLKHGRVLHRLRNILIVRVQSVGFSLGVTGFDPLRDLRVNATVSQGSER
jgi:hypothetical protein